MRDRHLDLETAGRPAGSPPGPEPRTDPSNLRDRRWGSPAWADRRSGRARLLLPGALLVAIRAQLLAALVLVDLGLATFLQRSHTVIGLSSPVSARSFSKRFC